MFPRHADTDALGFEDELADFVFLTLLARLDVLPAQDAPANGAVDVTDDVLARDQVPRDRLALIRIRESRRGGVDVARRALYQERPPMSARETLADDLRREAEVRRAFCTLDV